MERTGRVPSGPIGGRCACCETIYYCYLETLLGSAMLGFRFRMLWLKVEEPESERPLHGGQEYGFVGHRMEGMMEGELLRSC